MADLAAPSVYFLPRERQVRVADRTPAWTWAALTAGVCLGGAIAEGFDDAVAVSYVIGGMVAGVPLLVAQRLRRDS